MVFGSSSFTCSRIVSRAVCILESFNGTASSSHNTTTLNAVLITFDPLCTLSGCPGS